MDRFDKRIKAATGGELRSEGITIVQVNVGLRCNQACVHCHLNASPRRTEMMSWPVMEDVIAAVRQIKPEVVDITGGAPELNENLPKFIAALSETGATVQVRTNLTALALPGNEHMPELLRDYRVQLTASLPCYMEENVTAQRGKGAYQTSIAMIKQLNDLGYGREDGLELNLVFNPPGPALPPPQADLETTYRQELEQQHGIVFTRLLTITNMPLGRFMESLEKEGKGDEYMRLLEESFNPATIEALMCRHQISIGWDGTLYDCDFHQAAGLPAGDGNPVNIRGVDVKEWCSRRVVTRDYCLGCTAGAGSSCGGALA